MKVSYFPGCTLKNKAKDLDLYAYRSAEALGVTLEEIEDWQCCGGVYPLQQDEIATRLASVRALHAAKEDGQDLITLCSMLRIPVCMHNVPEENIFRPASWNAFGMDKEGADYRACAAYGPMFKK